MTQEPPPWARPDPDAPAPTGPESTGPESTGPASSGPVSTGPVSSGPASSGPVPNGPVAPASAEPQEAPAIEEAPLFPDRAPSGEALLFPVSGSRPRSRVPQDQPEIPRTARRVRVDPQPGPAGAAPPQPARGAPARGGPPRGTPPQGAPPPGRRPPPMPASPDPADPAAPPVAADPRVGVLAGGIVVTTARRSYPGLPILVVAAAIAVTAVAGRALLGELGGALLAAGVLVPALLVGAVAAARWFTGRGSDLTVSVRRFRVQPADGRTTSYLLEGEPPPDALRPGDLVRVRGRRVRDGHVVARSVDVLATLGGPVVRTVLGRPSSAVIAAQWLSHLSIAVAALLLLASALLVGGAGT